MISRQQTQFKAFLSDQEDPNFVFDENGNLMFSNSAALKLYQRSGSLGVKSKIRIFQFRK
jgi:PAS domain-containing protein